MAQLCAQCFQSTLLLWVQGMKLLTFEHQRRQWQLLAFTDNTGILQTAQLRQTEALRSQGAVRPAWLLAEPLQQGLLFGTTQWAGGFIAGCLPHQLIGFAQCAAAA